MSGVAPVATTHRGVERVLRTIAGALAAVGAFALAGIFVLVFASVIMRYVWGQPFNFTEELSGLLMTLAVFTLLPARCSKRCIFVSRCCLALRKGLFSASFFWRANSFC
jgi:hypothetical protein